MGFWSIFTRKYQPEIAPHVARQQSRGDRSNLTIKDAPDLIAEIRDGLAFVKERRGLKSQAEVILFLIRSFIAHEKRRLAEQGVPTIQPKKTASEKIGEYAASLPALPRVGLAGKAEVAERIDLCRAVLADNPSMPTGLRKSWRHALEANERLAVILNAELPLECRRAHGVLVDHRHYYRPSQGKAKMMGRANFVNMDVHSFVAEAQRLAS